MNTLESALSFYREDSRAIIRASVQRCIEAGTPWEVQLPMFPGYFFACPSFEEETLIRREKGVWNLKVLSEPEEEGLLEDLKIVRECELLSREHQLVVKPGLQAGQTRGIRKWWS